MPGGVRFMGHGCPDLPHTWVPVIPIRRIRGSAMPSAVPKARTHSSKESPRAPATCAGLTQGRVVRGSAGVSRQRVGAAAEFADDALACPLAHLDTEAVQVGDV